MALIDKVSWMPAPQRIAAALWISFLCAGVASGVFFSILDPMAILSCSALPDLSRIGMYTIGFLFFWMLAALSAIAAVFFVYPSTDS